MFWRGIQGRAITCSVFKGRERARGGEARLVLCPLSLCPKFELSMGGGGRRVRNFEAIIFNNKIISPKIVIETREFYGLEFGHQVTETQVKCTWTIGTLVGSRVCSSRPSGVQRCPSQGLSKSSKLLAPLSPRPAICILSLAPCGYKCLLKSICVYYFVFNFLSWVRVRRLSGGRPICPHVHVLLFWVNCESIGRLWRRWFATLKRMLPTWWQDQKKGFSLTWSIRQENWCIEKFMISALDHFMWLLG